MARSAGYREVRGKLSIFGWLWRLLLLGWQVLMIVWFITYTGKVAPMVEGNDAAAAGAAIGVGLSWMMILFFWAGGTVILGLFVLLTRRTKAMVPIDTESS